MGRGTWKNSELVYLRGGGEGASAKYELGVDEREDMKNVKIKNLKNCDVSSCLGADDIKKRVNKNEIHYYNYTIIIHKHK